MILQKISGVLCIFSRVQSLYGLSNRPACRFLETKTYDPLRILFCGSDGFSIASLKALHEEHLKSPDRIASIDVVCRPGKRVGRGLKKIREVPIKSTALDLSLPIHEIDTFKGWTPPVLPEGPINLIIAVSFGLFVPPRILNGNEMPESGFASVVPAQLSFLAIYNPLLATTDETVTDQIVFYTPRSSRLRGDDSSSVKGDGQNTNEWDERLRQVGLAQGMVKLASNFSDGKAVDYVETDKSRIVLHELEKNWWILASVDLTRLPTSAARSEATSQNEMQSALFQYSSKEMCPPQLLLQHLIRAHSIFLLLHDFTLDGLYQRVGRSVFCGLLERFWEKFAWTWDILLSGNPAVDIFNGIKLSAGGELGIGVGEEQWGSGERAVLEDLVTRTDGLVDLVVSRFGDEPAPIEEPSLSKESNNSPNAMDGKLKWLGLDVYPQPSDGVIFAGTGAVSRPSLVQISQWMEWIYRYGDNAYGVGGDPSSTRRRRRRKIRAKQPSRDTSAAPVKTERTADSSPRQAPDRPFSPGIPRPLVTGTPEPSQDSHQKDNSNVDDDNSSTRSGRWSVLPGFGAEKAKRYLTLGYGSSWSLWPQTLPSHPRASALKNDVDGPQEEAKQKNPPTTTGTDLERDQPAEGDQAKARSDTFGSFIIGLRDEPGNFRGRSYDDNTFIGKPKDGIVLRTLHIWLAASGDTTDQQKKAQVVVYAHQPFMFTFIFDPQTPSLHEPSFYHSIQHQLRPLHKPLLASTSLENIVSRISISDGVFDPKSRFSTKIHPVYDLVYDPSNLTIRSSIPNIPDLGSHQTESSDPNTPPWSRVESVNIHHRLLNTYIETRSHPDELERTYKTNRGWWVVWVRVSGDDNHHDDHSHQEAFVVRKASDYVSSSSQHNRTGSNSARFFRDLGGASSSSSFSGFQFSRADMAPGKLAEGLGLDARRYIESLLSLNR